MKCLPNIKITNEEKQNLLNQNNFNYGEDSLIFEAPSLFGENRLAKIWDMDAFFCKEKTIQNKFEKLKRLYQIDALKDINDIQITASISCEEEIIGYLMNKSPYREIDYFPTTHTEMLNYLWLARQKLKQFEQMGILYGDISSSNILFFKNDVCFCDLDNVAYQELDMDIVPVCLGEFMRKYEFSSTRKVNKKAISYMYNLFTIKQLCFLDENRLVEEYLESEQIPRELLPLAYKEIRKQMRHVTPLYEGYYFIDYVKEKYKEKLKRYK